MRQRTRVNFRLVIAIIATCLFPIPSCLAEQVSAERFTDGYPDGGTTSDLKVIAHPWQRGLEKRAIQDWAPTEGLEHTVEIQAALTDSGRLYEIEFVKSSGDAQADADCLQALLSAQAYDGGTIELANGGRISTWNFTFADSSNARLDNHAVYRFFNTHPKVVRENSILVFKIPTDVLIRYPGRFTNTEIISPTNLFPINPACRDNSRPKDKCGALRPLAMYTIINHYAKWQNFMVAHPNATKSEITEFSKMLESA